MAALVEHEIFCASAASPLWYASSASPGPRATAARSLLVEWKTELSDSVAKTKRLSLWQILTSSGRFEKNAVIPPLAVPLLPVVLLVLLLVLVLLVLLLMLLMLLMLLLLLVFMMAVSMLGDIRIRQKYVVLISIFLYPQLRLFEPKQPHRPPATPQAPFLRLQVFLGDAQGRCCFKPGPI